MRLTVWQEVKLFGTKILDFLLAEDYHRYNDSRGSPHRPKVTNPMPLLSTYTPDTSKETPPMAKSKLQDVVNGMKSIQSLLTFMDDVKSADSAQFLYMLDQLEKLNPLFKDNDQFRFLEAATELISNTMSNHYATQEQVLEAAKKSNHYNNGLLYLHTEELTKGDSGKEYFTLTTNKYKATDIVAACNAFGYVTEMPKGYEGKTSLNVALGKYVNATEYKGERFMKDGVEMGTLQLFPHKIRQKLEELKTAKAKAKTPSPETVKA
jgi:hypothetical protein